jgi:hypothetical protein
VRGAAGSSFTALLIDREVADRLNATPQDRVVVAQDVLAETAAAWNELPALASQRLLVIAPRDSPAPSTTAALLTGLSSAPWITLRTATDALAALPPEGPAVRLPIARPTGGALLAALLRARRALATIDAVMPQALAQRDAIRRLLLSAESDDWAASPQHAISLAGAAMHRATAILTRVRTPNRHVTLTSRGGLVPVTILNDTGVPVRLQVRLESSKLVFPRGARQVVRIPGRVRTLSFSAEARAAGAFPIAVLLLTPDGEHALGRGVIVVRSTAVSAVTLMATGGGALFLLAAWGRRLRRERVAHRAQQASDRAGGASPG